MTTHATDQARPSGAGIVAGVAATFLGRGYTALLALATVPILVRALGPGLYGLLAAATAIGGLGGQLNLGMGTALCKMAAEAAQRGDRQRIVELFRSALGVALAAAAVAVTGVIAFRRHLATALVHAGPAVRQDVGFTLWIAGIALGLALLSEPLSAVPQALQRFDLLSSVRALAATIGALGMVGAVLLGFSLRAVLIAALAAAAVLVAGFAVVVHRLLPDARLSPRLDRSDAAALLRFSGPVLLAAAGAIAAHRLDRLVVAHYLPIAALAFYAVPYSLAQKATLLTENVATVVLPSASGLSAAGRGAPLRELYLRAQKLVALLAIPATAALALAAEPILRAYAGPLFADGGSVPLQLLALGFLLNGMGYVPGVIVQAVGRPGTYARFSCMNGALVLGLVAALTPRYGIIGASAGFLAAEVVAIPLFAWRVQRLIRVPWRALWGAVLLPAAACGSCALPPLLLARVLGWGAAGWSAALAAAAVTFMAAAWRFGLDEVEQTHARNLLRVGRRTGVHPGPR